MITADGENLQLSNNILQVFKLDNEKSLELKGVRIIAREEDGYINLNQLCKAGGKEFRKWKENKKSKAFIQAFYSSGRILPSSGKNLPVEIIKYNAGGNGERHHWGHPMIAINVAQWISPLFDVQVSKWVFELLITGKVVIGHELSNTELELEYKNKIQNVMEDYEKLKQLHNSLKFKRKYHELEKGDCVYICHNKLEPPNRYKIGKTNNINKTLKSYRRNAPYTLLDYLFYTNKMTLLEDNILNKYISDRRPINHEVIEDIELKTIVDDLQQIIEIIRIPGTVGSFEQIQKYNDDINTPAINVIDDDKHIFVMESSDDETDKTSKHSKSKVKKNEDVEKRIDRVESKKDNMYNELLEELENYTDKKLKELLYKFKLPVSGVKEVKKNRIRAHLKKINNDNEDNEENVNNNLIKTRKCDTCGESKELTIENFRVFGYGFKKRCKKCDIKSCKTVVGVRVDIKSEIKDDTVTATCSKCKSILSVDDFYKNKSNKSGRESQCKNCSAKNKNKKINGGVLKSMRLIKKRPTNVGDNEKWCPDCELVKKKSDFRKRKAAKDGCQTYCIECDNARTRKNRMKRKIYSKT